MNNMKIKIFIFNQIQENTYLIYDKTKEAVIIDCGASNEMEYKKLEEFISSNDLRLKYLLNTHLHFDHTLGNHFIYEKYNIRPMYNHEEEKMPNLRSQAGMMGFDIDYDSGNADKYINDGDVIRFGTTEIKALLTPGHSPGSLSYYVEKANCIFTGDALFERSIGRTDLWEGNFDTLIKGIREKLYTLPDNTVVYPGHGPSTTIQEEKQFNPYTK
jgi:Zn-dependent hydrolases, including glyoxylases